MYHIVYSLMDMVHIFHEQYQQNYLEDIHLSIHHHEERTHHCIINIGMEYKSYNLKGMAGKDRLLLLYLKHGHVLEDIQPDNFHHRKSSLNHT